MRLTRWAAASIAVVGLLLTGCGQSPVSPLSGAPVAASKPAGRTLGTLALSSAFRDGFEGFDSARWFKADGWANGAPFACGWRGDHVAIADGTASLSISDRPASGLPYSGGELRTLEPVGYGRVEGRLRAAKGAGVVTALITYTGPAEGTVHDEVDIEILGKDTTKLQVNYFTEGVGGHEVVIPLGFDAAEGFHDYAFEWTATAIRWYVDGKLVHTEDGSRGPLPKTPGRVMANLWPGVGVDGWLGPFDYPGTPVTAELDHIGYAPAR
jgi:beta-glucanase (GH16 family)